VIAPKLKALEAERLSVEEKLAAADDKGKPVALHPAAIKNYLTDVQAMRAALDDPDAAERPELIAPLRRLIHSVVIHAQPGVKGAFDVEIKGRLQELLGAPFLRRSMGGGLVVAGGDSRVSPSPLRTLRHHPEGKKSGLRPFCLAPISKPNERNERLMNDLRPTPFLAQLSNLRISPLGS
jgi:hypothetical protein